MLLGIFNLVYFIITLIFQSILLLFKIVYYILKSIIKLFVFLFTNNFCRFPTIIVLFGLLLSIKPLIIASIYFAYVVNYFAIKFNIYYAIKNNVFFLINKIINYSTIRSSIHTLCCDYCLLNNTILEGPDDDFKLYHLVITERCIYNVIPLSSITSDCYFNSSTYNFYNHCSTQISQLKELIHNLLPDTLPVSTLFITNKSDFSTISPTDLGEVITIDSLAEYIDNAPFKKHLFSPKEIKDMLLDNKLWLIDILFVLVFNFIKRNKKILLFIVLLPIFYLIYMIAIIFIGSFINNYLDYIVNYIIY